MYVGETSLVGCGNELRTFLRCQSALLQCYCICTSSAQLRWIMLTRAVCVRSGQSEMEEKDYQITFGQIYLSRPTITEADGETNVLFPMAARLRNLT